MADLNGFVSQQVPSIVDQLMGRNKPQTQMPNIYGDQRQPAMPAPNAGIPNPAALAATTPAAPTAPNWWDDEEAAPPKVTPAPAAGAAPAPAPAAAPTAPATAPQFEVSEFSLFRDDFKASDIGTVVDTLVADGRINPMRAVQQADLDALLGGDMTKLPTVLNAAVAAGIKEAMTATTTLISNSMGKALAPVFDKYAQHTEGTAAKTAVDSEYKTPAERTLAGMYREKYLSKYPRATAQQTSAAVKQAMDQLGTDLVTARQPPQKTAQSVDWASELN